MKISFLYDAIYPWHIGGKEKRLYDLTKNLKERGHEVHIYSMKWWKGNKIIKQDNITYHSLCKYHPLYLKKGRRSIKQGIMFGLASLRLLKEDFDVLDSDHMVYFHLFPAKLACILRNKPLIITWNEVWGKEYWKSYMGKKGIIGYWIEKLASKLPNKIISVSKHTTNKLIHDLGVQKEKITTIPNGIDFSFFQKIKKSPKKSDHSDIVFAGRLLKHKNVDLLIRAIKILKEKDKSKDEKGNKISKNNNKNKNTNKDIKAIKTIKAIIIGDGPELVNLKALTNSLDLQDNIKFTGFIKSESAMYSIMKSSKVFVLPSEREGFGIVAIEANALGLPVITLDSKDNASQFLIKQGKNGFITNKDPVSLAQTINLALKQVKQSSKMSNHCKDEARQYDWSSLIPKFEEVYK